MSLCLKALNNKRNSVLPKHTLFKVLYFILAKLKNYTLFILYFSQILYYRIKVSQRIKSTILNTFFPCLSDICQQFIDQ